VPAGIFYDDHGLIKLDSDSDETNGAEISGNMITMHFEDSLRGFDDLASTNGSNVDIGGQGVVFSASTSNGSGCGSGCFILTATGGEAGCVDRP
jgi:hypothetical protein